MAADLQVPVGVHTEKVLPWSQRNRVGTREDRTLREIRVSLPPKIANFKPLIPNYVAVASDAAIAKIARLDEVHGTQLSALALLLLRAESVASSKIEHIEASVADFVRATHGMKSNSSATSMVASAGALTHLISTVNDQGPITLANILAAHQVLMADDPQEQHYAGRLRDVQNWIGGSDHSPRNAMFIPPPPETVEDYLADLLEFANRDDIPALTQAAVTHAQFESIHPFTDGNGRIGRALINTILRRRGVTTEIVLPIASALVAKKETYFAVLGAYRDGDAAPIIRALSYASQAVAQESQETARLLAGLPQQWLNSYLVANGRLPRSDSAVHQIIAELLNTSFFTAEDLHAKLGGAPARIYNGIKLLSEASILSPLTDRTRNQVWGAEAILTELEELGARIAKSTQDDPSWRDLRLSLATAQG